MKFQQKSIYYYFIKTETLFTRKAVIYHRLNCCFVIRRNVTFYCKFLLLTNYNLMNEVQLYIYIYIL